MDQETRHTRNYLRSLPFAIAFSCNGYRVKIYHAAPINNKLYWPLERDDHFFRGMARLADADIIIYGHTHIPYRKDITGVVFINAGSVGRPKDGDPRTCAAVLDLRAGEVDVEFLRIGYDVEKTAAAIGRSGLPAYFAERLRKGR